MNALFASIITVLLALSKTLKVNYCDPYLCVVTPGKKHIACNNSGTFGPNCPAKVRLIDVKPLIPIILNEHNKGRNALAGGELVGYETASHMATMQWDDELALMAKYNAIRCLPKHDDCRNTKRFHFSGQNINQISYDGDEYAFSDEKIVQNAIIKWFSEYILGTMDAMREFPKVAHKYRQFGRFALVTIDENNFVGCAAIRYKTELFNNFLVTCNYARNLVAESYIYEEGPPASACKSGKNEDFPSLCATDEKYQMRISRI